MESGEPGPEAFFGVNKNYSSPCFTAIQLFKSAASKGFRKNGLFFTFGAMSQT